jgi:hypothetical protein
VAGGIAAAFFLMMHWPIFGFETVLTIIPIAIFLSVLRIVCGNLTAGR